MRCKISDEALGTRPFLIGHSLGGTLAAIFAAAEPQSVSGLVLLGAPASFPTRHEHIPGRSRLPGSVRHCRTQSHFQARYCHT